MNKETWKESLLTVGLAIGTLAALLFVPGAIPVAITYLVVVITKRNRASHEVNDALHCAEGDRDE